MNNLCKGGCGQSAEYGDWCSITYYKCPGYLKKLSDKAKLRGNNGINGKCKKKFKKSDYIERRIFNFICPQCDKSYEQELTIIGGMKKNPLCRSCSMINSYHNKNKNKPYNQQTKKVRKSKVWIEQNKKCNKCDFSKYDLETGPYELHHIDGNSKNTNRDNEEVLCANCHMMTPNYGFRGKKHKYESKQKIRISILEINKCRKDTQ